MNKALRDFVGTVLTGFGVAFLAGAVVSNVEAVTQTRIYRDFYKLTPFHSVDVYQTTLTDDGLVSIGELTKRRCEFADLRGFVTVNGSRRIRALIDTSVEDARGVSGNRHPSNDAEAWGPWLIEWPATEPEPEEWFIYAGHWCPVLDDDGNPVMSDSTGLAVTAYETNLFARGKWATTED